MARLTTRLSKPERKRLIDEAAKLRLQGQTYRDIAATIGISPTCARRYVELAGFRDQQPAQILGADGKMRVSRYHKGR